MSNDILIVDDESDIRTVLCGILGDEGYSTREAATSEQALKEINERLPSLVILDIWLRESELDGIEILQWLKNNYPSVPVIMISGHGNIETAVNSIKAGAYDFIEKPFQERSPLRSSPLAVWSNLSAEPFGRTVRPNR